MWSVYPSFNSCGRLASSEMSASRSLLITWIANMTVLESVLGFLGAGHWILEAAEQWPVSYLIHVLKNPRMLSLKHDILPLTCPLILPPILLEPQSGKNPYSWLVSQDTHFVGTYM